MSDTVQKYSWKNSTSSCEEIKFNNNERKISMTLQGPENNHVSQRLVACESREKGVSVIGRFVQGPQPARPCYAVSRFGFDPLNCTALLRFITPAISHIYCTMLSSYCLYLFKR